MPARKALKDATDLWHVVPIAHAHAHGQLRGFTQFSARPRHYESFVEPPSPAITPTPAEITQLWGMVPHDNYESFVIAHARDLTKVL